MVVEGGIQAAPMYLFNVSTAMSSIAGAQGCVLGLAHERLVSPVPPSLNTFARDATALRHVIHQFVPVPGCKN